MNDTHPPHGTDRPLLAAIGLVLALYGLYILATTIGWLPPSVGHSDAGANHAQTEQAAAGRSEGTSHGAQAAPRSPSIRPAPWRESSSLRRW